MSKRKEHRIIKKDGTPQRSDVILSKEIAATLVGMIMRGESLYPKQGYILYTTIGENGEEIENKLSVRTIQQWVVRNNVIPETQDTLRDILDNARAVYRDKQIEERRKKMIDRAEKEMMRTLNLRTNLPVVTMFGTLTRDQNTGQLVRKENAGLLKIKMDVAKYIKDRLDPAYIPKSSNDNVNKNLNFSLADLRQAAEGNQQAA